MGADAIHSDNFLYFTNLPSTLALNIKATDSETSAYFYNFIHRQIAEDGKLQSRRLENIGSRIIDMFEMRRFIN